MRMLEELLDGTVVRVVANVKVLPPEFRWGRDHSQRWHESEVYQSLLEVLKSVIWPKIRNQIEVDAVCRRPYAAEYLTVCGVLISPNSLQQSTFQFFFSHDGFTSGTFLHQKHHSCHSEALKVVEISLWFPINHVTPLWSVNNDFFAWRSVESILLIFWGADIVTFSYRTTHFSALQPHLIPTKIHWHS